MIYIPSIRREGETLYVNFKQFEGNLKKLDKAADDSTRPTAVHDDIHHPMEHYGDCWRVTIPFAERILFDGYVYMGEDNGCSRT